MRLEPLYRVRFEYEPEQGGVELEGGLQRLFFFAEGRCEGRITGRMRGANHPRRRPDGTYCPDFQGVVETDDGATIFFDWYGYGRSYPAGRRQIVAGATHLADDERYARLNDVVCAVEGEVRAREDRSGVDLVIDVYELVEEFQP
jgi:hypothetical protein